jgi:hypothetical protein
MMSSSVQRVFLLFLLLLAFDASSFVFGAPQAPAPLVRQLSQRFVNGDTNAKRFARGLPPLPPVRRASGTETARRATTSDTQTFKGKIKVSSVLDHHTIGFLQLSANEDRYIVGSASTEHQFSATFFKQGVTASVNFFDNDAPASHPFLAGLISPGLELLVSNTNFAVVGDAPVQTSPGSTPQSGGSVSIPGSQYETAIWNYSPSPPTLTASWVNHDGSKPIIFIVWDTVRQTLYLTANPAAVIRDHPGSEVVELSPIG